MNFGEAGLEICGFEVNQEAGSSCYLDLTSIGTIGAAFRGSRDVAEIDNLVVNKDNLIT